MKLALDKVTAVPRSQMEFSALVALGASGWLALLLVVAGAPVPLRILAAFGFTCFCPGLALLSHLKRLGPLERGVLGVALSVSLATLLSEAMALFAAWSATGALAGLALLCSAAVALRLWKLRHPQWRLLNRRLPKWHLPQLRLPDRHLPRLRLPNWRSLDLRLRYWRLQTRLLAWEPPRVRLPHWRLLRRRPPHRPGRKANATKQPLSAARGVKRWTRPGRNPLSWSKGLWPASRWRS